MTDAAATTSQATDAAKTAADQAPEEWKPEPRQWTWKDLFTAPMLAFKPKCMLISAVTAIALGLLARLYVGIAPDDGNGVLGKLLFWAFLTVGLTVFSLAATLVAVFMKADLLDDEFLTLKEAMQQFKGRLMPALLVPLFLMGLVGGFQVLIALPELLASIPVVGPAGWALLYPLVFVLGLFVVLLTIAVVLSVFVFPAIIAIRRHGWFDNVVDTFEAVGTKPHVLVGSLVLTFVLVGISQGIGFGAMDQLRRTAVAMPGPALKETEYQAAKVRDRFWESFRAENVVLAVVGQVSSNIGMPAPALPRIGGGYAAAGPDVANGYHRVTGWVTGIWQIIIGSFVIGYCYNLFIGGGMLTYLVVREDDYWDDEDLEDLDKLAKELEEEAKQEGAAAAAEAKPTDAKPAETKPAEAPVAEAKPADAKPAEPGPVVDAVPAKPADAPTDGPKPA